MDRGVFRLVNSELFISDLVVQMETAVVVLPDSSKNFIPLPLTSSPITLSKVAGGQLAPFLLVVASMLDLVHEVVTFWKTNKEHIYIPNYRDGLFKIERPTMEEMVNI